jgi:uncharacterized membrane-anchored protein
MAEFITSRVTFRRTGAKEKDHAFFTNPKDAEKFAEILESYKKCNYVKLDEAQKWQVDISDLKEQQNNKQNINIEKEKSNERIKN